MQTIQTMKVMVREKTTRKTKFHAKAAVEVHIGQIQNVPSARLVSKTICHRNHQGTRSKEGVKAVTKPLMGWKSKIRANLRKTMSISADATTTAQVASNLPPRKHEKQQSPRKASLPWWVKGASKSPWRTLGLRIPQNSLTKLQRSLGVSQGSCTRFFKSNE